MDGKQILRKPDRACRFSAVLGDTGERLFETLKRWPTHDARAGGEVDKQISTHEEWKPFAPQLERIVADIHRATAFIAVASFAGYGVAAWLGWRGQLLPALGVATFSYLFFRLYPLLSIQWARWRSVDDPATGQALAILEQAFEGRPRRELLLEVDAWLRRNSQTDR